MGRRKLFTATVLLLLLVVSTVLVWQVLLRRAGSRDLLVAFLDVGQGDTIYIETPNGTQVLVDGGRGFGAVRGLGRVMPWYDRTLDVVVATHPDLDHVGGLPQVFERYEIGMYIEPGVVDGGADQEALHAVVEREGLTPFLAREGWLLILDEDISLTFLFPNIDASTLESNMASIVTKLTYGDTAFFLTGDSPRAIEEHLVGRYGSALASTVLKLGHHGSRTSSSDSFLDSVDPRYAVVSAGCNNQYGHPHAEVLAPLEARDVTVLQTCKHGDVTFLSDGYTVRQMQ